MIHWNELKQAYLYAKHRKTVTSLHEKYASAQAFLAWAKQFNNEDMNELTDFYRDHVRS